MSNINTWPGWECVGQLGEGSFGKVYEIQKEEYGKVYTAALKVITIPFSRSEIRDAYSEGMDEQSVTAYFQEFVENIAAEFATMSEFKGQSNIVSYEDHQVIKHEDDIGWDILIRMELLTPLPDWSEEHPLEETDVIKLGCDICNALELCHENKIVHRDIKRENIFVDKFGNFKLGDFGIARTAEKTMANLSQKGTYNYMAPEIWNRQEYGRTADIYSVGMVLYQYLNKNRGPFMPTGDTIRPSDRDEAFKSRMSGKQIPPPLSGSEALKEVILKALAYNPKDRWKSAREFQDALKGCTKEMTTILFPPNPDNDSSEYDDDYDGYDDLSEYDNDYDGYGDSSEYYNDYDDLSGYNDDYDGYDDLQKPYDAPRKNKRIIRICFAGVIGLLLAFCAVAGTVYYINLPLKNGMTKEETKEILDEGNAYFNSGEYEQAIAYFEQIPSDSPHYKKAQSLLAEVQSAYQKEIIDRVDSYVEKDEFGIAFELIDEAQDQMPQNAGLQEAYENVYSAWKDSVLKLTGSYVADGEYEMALSSLKIAKASYPNDTELQEAYENTYSEWKTLVRERAVGMQYEEALSYLGAVIADYPDDMDLQTAFNSIQSEYQGAIRGNALQAAEDYVAVGDYAQAITIIRQAMEKNGQDRELAAKLAVYEDAYVSSVTAVARAQYIEYNADSIFAAEQMIGDALSVLQNNQILVSELAFYREHEPIGIISMPASSSGDSYGRFRTMDSAVDNQGNAYKDVIYVEEFAGRDFDYSENKWWLECYKTIDLDFQYSKITGVFFQNGKYSTASTESKFRILAFEGEDTGIGSTKIRLCSEKVTGNSAPVRFEADVSGRKYIRIRFLGDYNSGNEDEEYHYAYVSELYLWR